MKKMKLIIKQIWNKIKPFIKYIIGILLLIIGFIFYKEVKNKFIIKKWKKIPGDNNNILIKYKNGYKKIRIADDIDIDKIISVGISNEGDNNEDYHFKIKHDVIDRRNVNSVGSNMDI